MGEKSNSSMMCGMMTYPKGFFSNHDVWHDDIPLKDSFPSLFTIATSKEVWVEDVWEVEGRMIT